MWRVRTASGLSGTERRLLLQAERFSRKKSQPLFNKSFGAYVKETLPEEDMLLPK